MADIDAKAELDGDVYRTLLESTQAIPWKIDWATMTFAYIGPQIESLLGWTPESWASVQDWIDRMHPEDRAWVVDFCVAQSKDGIDHEADYRALCKNGEYVWIRDVVHVVRNADGVVEALVGFMFDISERKRTEEKLLNLQHELERLSFKDGLTGVGNRRHFDTVLKTEWAQAQRSGQPLSLVMLDIDYFKQYNDHYGHIQGDACLKRVGDLLDDMATRSRDLLARYGGEEFVLVLPQTDASSAHTMAERCRELIARARVPHENSPVAPLLTISLGVGTITPTADDEPLAFVDAVDRALYQAKLQGRNRTVVADVPRTGTLLPRSA